MPTAVNSEPARSRPSWRESLVFGVMVTAAIAATTARTALALKMDDHDHFSSSEPAPRRPRIAPDAAKPDHTATPRARWSGGKDAVIVDSVPGMIIAAPRPIITRIRIRCSGVSACAATAAAAPKTRQPRISTLRRP